LAGWVEEAAEGGAEAEEGVPEGGDEEDAEYGDCAAGGDGVVGGEPGEGDGEGVFAGAEADV